MQHRRGILGKTLESSTDVRGRIYARSSTYHTSKPRPVDIHASVLQSNIGQNETVEEQNVQNKKEMLFLSGSPCPKKNCHVHDQ